LNQLIEFHQIQHEGYDAEGDFGGMIFNSVASTIPKSQAFKLLWWIENLLQSTWTMKGEVL